MLRLPAGFALVVLSVPSFAGAQERLTLSRAVTSAVERSANVRAAAARDRAAADADVQHAALLPHLSLSESWMRSNQPAFVFGSLLNARQFASADFAVDRLNHPDAQAAFTSRISVRQLIFDGGARTGAIDAARYGRDAATAALDRARADVALEVTRVYGLVLVAQAAVATTEAAIAGAEEDLARATRRRNAGAATDADVLAIAVQATSLRERGIEARGQLAIARAELNRLAGSPIDHPFLVDEPQPEEETPANLNALFTEAEQARPELKASQAAEAQARASQKQARAGWLPIVAAEAGYALDGLTFGTRSLSWAIGGQVRWDLSFGGATAASERAAAAAVVAAQAARADALAAVQLDVVRAVQHLNVARARVDVGRDLIAQTREHQRIIRNRYEAGVVSVNDVLAATTATVDAEAQRIKALVDLIVARAELQRALGRSPVSTP
jgi:outer membrane protein